MSSTEKKTTAARRSVTPRTTKPRTPSTRAAAPRTRAAKLSLDSPFAPSHEDIQRRAYELFLMNGGQPGHDLEHWLQAERELSRRV